MDIFDRLGNLIRTILDDEPGEEPARGRIAADSRFRTDPDLRDAWEELERFMHDPNPGDPAKHATDQPRIPESLRIDYRNLEVPFGAPLTEVRRSYKRLLTEFHPDKHSSDPNRFRTATEVTKRLNRSYERIRALQEAGMGVPNR